MNDRIFVFTKYDRLGASSRMRFFNYLSFFSEKYKFQYSPLFDNKYLNNLYDRKKNSKIHIFSRYFKRLVTTFRVALDKNIDVVWIEKELMPYIPIPLEVILSISGKKVIYDYDDAVFHNYDLKYLSWIFDWKFSCLAKYSDLIFAGNKYLKDRLINFGATNVNIVPTVIDEFKYSDVHNVSINDDRTTLVWIGSPSTQKYLSIVDDVIFSLQQKYCVEFHVIGCNSQLELKCCYTRIKWSENDEITSLNRADIGIMPLFDSAFERGKCGYKIIQYFALGKPVCCSPVGVNNELVHNDVNGYLCQSSHDWYKSLEKLIISKDLRSSFGNHGKMQVFSNYTYQSQVLNVESYIDKL